MVGPERHTQVDFCWVLSFRQHANINPRLRRLVYCVLRFWSTCQNGHTKGSTALAVVVSLWALRFGSLSTIPRTRSYVGSLPKSKDSLGTLFVHGCSREMSSRLSRQTPYFLKSRLCTTVLSLGMMSSSIKSCWYPCCLTISTDVY